MFSRQWFAVGTLACLLATACFRPSPGPAQRPGPTTALGHGQADASAATTRSPDAPAQTVAAPVVLELCDEPRCGPSPTDPLGLCPDGVHYDGPGPCVYRPDGACGWTRLRCPRPGGSQPIARTSDPRLLLKSRKIADRIAGAKLVLANKAGLGARQRSDQYAALLANCLGLSDPELRRWAVRALATLDDRVIPILKRARLREASVQVIREIEIALRRHQPAAVLVSPKECTKKNRKKMMKWPIRELCDPIGHYPPVLFPLGDGTNIYQGRGRGPACFRGKRKARCHVKCLPGGSLIDTPHGTVPVRTLRKGALVWSFDLAGNRVAKPIKATRSVFAGSEHELVEVVLSDGRRLRASGPHPTAIGHLSDLAVGARLDGANVLEIRVVRLEGNRTFDLLPEGPSGLYIADGVILGSSLAGTKE